MTKDLFACNREYKQHDGYENTFATCTQNRYIIWHHQSFNDIIARTKERKRMNGPLKSWFIDVFGFSFHSNDIELVSQACVSLSWQINR